MVGAWCLVGHSLPAGVAGRPGLQIPPQPQTGLQTVTWSVEGSIQHRDSLGSLATIGPGQMNLMTSGRGIAHAEESPTPHPPVMHGLQLWIALPDAARQADPVFSSHTGLPVLTEGGVSATVLVGTLAEVSSPAAVHSPLVGAELLLAAGAVGRLPLVRGFEHAALTMTGAAEVAGTTVTPGSLLYLD